MKTTLAMRQRFQSLAYECFLENETALLLLKGAEVARAFIPRSLDGERTLLYQACVEQAWFV